MDTDIIRSFLVSVGVQVDERGLKRFDKTVKDISKTTKEFAEALTAAAVAASVAVVKISEQFEDLYYASQRLHSSVENIKAFTFGVKQMGGNADAARGSLEAFALSIQKNPAMLSVLGSQIGQTLTGDAVKDFETIGRRLREMKANGMSTFRLYQIGEQAGIDDNTLQAMLRGTDKWEDRFHDIMRRNGVDMDALAASSTNLMQNFRILTTEIEAHFLGILQKIRPDVLEAGVVVAALAGAFGAVALVLGGVAAEFLAVGLAVGLLVDDFNAWRNGGGAFDWGGWADDIDAAVSAVKELGSAVGGILEAVASLKNILSDKQWDALGHTFLRAAIDEIHMLADSLNVVKDLLHGDFKGALRDAKKFGADAFNDDSKPSAPGPSNKARAAALAGHPANSNVAGSSAQQAEDYFMRQGWTKDQARGIAAGIHAEGGTAGQMAANGAYGIGQWRGPRLKELFRRYGPSPTKAQEYEFLNWEMTGGDKTGTNAMRGQTTSAGTLSAYINGVMRPGPGTAGDMRRGMAYLSDPKLGADGPSRNVTVTAQTDITVHGATDPHATGKAVGAAVDNSNAMLTRNARTAIQ